MNYLDPNNSAYFITLFYFTESWLRRGHYFRHVWPKELIKNPDESLIYRWTFSCFHFHASELKAANFKREIAVKFQAGLILPRSRLFYSVVWGLRLPWLICQKWFLWHLHSSKNREEGKKNKRYVATETEPQTRIFMSQCSLMKICIHVKTSVLKLLGSQWLYVYIHCFILSQNGWG